VAEAPYILWARPDLPARSLKELVETAKAKPGALTFGSGGQGTSSHLSAELFFEKAGISVIHVPFKGVGGSMAEVMAGRVDFGGSSIASPIGHIRTGKLRPLAVTAEARPSKTELAKSAGLCRSMSRTSRARLVFAPARATTAASPLRAPPTTIASYVFAMACDGRPFAPDARPTNGMQNAGKLGNSEI